MKFSSLFATLAVGLASASPLFDTTPEAPELSTRAPVNYTLGLDVDQASGILPWSSLYSYGYRFVYYQATRGLTVINGLWPAQKTTARADHFFTGGIHNPDPFVATPYDQAKFFTSQGGDWIPDGETLTGALYLEKDLNGTYPYCYSITNNDWIGWIKEFTEAYKQINGRYPVILTTYDWWKQCTYGFTGFSSYIEIWIINLSGTPNPLPVGWPTWALWRFAPNAAWNDDNFNGDITALQAWAL